MPIPFHSLALRYQNEAGDNLDVIIGFELVWEGIGHDHSYVVVREISVLRNTEPATLAALPKNLWDQSMHEVQVAADKLKHQIMNN